MAPKKSGTEKVFINLTRDHGVIYNPGVGEEARQDLQPADNPHEVDEQFAKELVHRGRAVILEDEEEIADALKAKNIRKLRAEQGKAAESAKKKKGGEE